MHITFIQPCVGRKPGARYPQSWMMEPLSIASLSERTPRDTQRVFYDDRFDAIPYDKPTDMVAITVETYTARRAYQIANAYREKHIPVVMGGFHPTLAPDEAGRHADALVIGEAEDIWPQVLRDAACGKLQKTYAAPNRPDLAGRFPDRSIFAGKRYSMIGLVETARGCVFNCDFCSVAGFYQSTYRPRPVADIIAELKALKKRYIFFVDDNFYADPERTLALVEALIPLRLRWVVQSSINIAHNTRLLKLMKQSGCMGLLIGFESLDAKVLSAMGKKVNEEWRFREDALKQLQKAGLGIYATFVFGYDADTEKTFARTFEFAQKHKFFFTAFNHLVPFPGTPLYRRLCAENRILQDPWWLHAECRFGDIVFQPAHFTPQSLAELCFHYRQRFYSFASILRRSTNVRANCGDPASAFTYFFQNLNSRREIVGRQGLPLGIAGE